MCSRRRREDEETGFKQGDGEKGSRSTGSNKATRKKGEGGKEVVTVQEGVDQRIQEQWIKGKAEEGLCLAAQEDKGTTRVMAGLEPWQGLCRSLAIGLLSPEVGVKSNPS
ncbi:hypothetical protein E3N88_02658 [Mikania micrantha]|uniref:Uncharacterized protein n=1 Tax=Mikania micrantha TaxID=192012 RepID=A0A5N6Q4L5_9ASTR|nr:hypothetical protein E3N88_02658 [Mikania micrantha]